MSPPNSETPASEVGQRLRELRQERRLSLRELARLSGISANALSQIERGLTSPSVSTLYRLVEGMNLPTTVVQRGIEYNKLHMDIGSVQIQTPRQEKRIATTFRGNGPRGLREFKGKSLDGYLLQSAVTKGARHIRARVDGVRWTPGT